MLIVSTSTLQPLGFLYAADVFLLKANSLFISSVMSFLYLSKNPNIWNNIVFLNS